MFAILSNPPPSITLKSQPLPLSHKWIRPMVPLRCSTHGHRYHCFVSTSTSHNSILNKGYGAFGGVLTLEPSKIDLSSKIPSKISPLLDNGGDSDDGGSGGRLGGGNSGGGGCDDDEYNFKNFDDNGEGEGESEGGIFRRRRLIGEVFTRETINAVLSEWMKTMSDLPLSLRELGEMGLLSSAQFTKFFSFNAPRTIARFLIKTLPNKISTDLSGKIMADPSMLYKLLFQAVSSFGCSVWFDIKYFRRDHSDGVETRWHEVISKAVTRAVCNTFIVWSLAPCYRYEDNRSYSSHWSIMLRKLPNNVFEKSYRLREFDLQKRVVSFFHKAVILFAVGFNAKGAQVGFSTLMNRKESEEKMSRKIAKVSTEAFNAGLSLGLLSNFRYQLVCGIERGLDLYFDVIYTSLALSLATRFLNDNSMKYSHRTSSADGFMLKNVTTWFKQANTSSDTQLGKRSRRRRITGKQLQLI